VATIAVTSMASRLPARIREHNLTLVAAGVAFYAFLALVPMLVAFIAIYGLVADPNDVRRQVEDIGSSLPREVQDFLVYQLTQIINANSAGLSITAVLAIVLALWSASGGTAAMITGIHVAREEEEPTGFVAKRGKALALTFGAIVFLGVVIFLVAALPPLASDLGTAGRVALDVLRWPALAIAMLVGIGLLYRFSVGPHPRSWGGVLTRGAVVAMVGWLVVSGLFALYTGTVASYGKTYGALASIVVVLIWLWLTALVLLVGAEVDGADRDGARRG
jgi:membrane protein